MIVPQELVFALRKLVTLARILVACCFNFDLSVEHHHISFKDFPHLNHRCRSNHIENDFEQHLLQFI